MKNDLAKADSPHLEYYFDAVPYCSSKKGIDYNHLIRTFTLRSRYEFDCLDLDARFENFKTPQRVAPTYTTTVSSNSTNKFGIYII